MGQNKRTILDKFKFSCRSNCVHISLKESTGNNEIGDGIQSELVCGYRESNITI